MGIAIPAKATDVYLQWGSWTAHFPWRAPLPFSIVGSTLGQTSTSLHRLHVPVSSRTPCLGMTPVSLRLDGSQLLFVFVCCILYCLICLTWENWFESCTQYFLLKWSLKKSDWREPFIFACYFFPCVSGWLIPHTWGMRILWSDRFQSSRSVQPTVLIA